ncbi:DNA adenine methylase [Alkalinema pantanalense CENA528]|uniref:DNA adenine methylase n=1 Tax=Alkalinema pantanalense TaxID=1620705 RepID=UPI003D700CA4
MLTQVRPTAIPRPFLKWAGGKSQLLPQYESFFPRDYRTYYEPFLGGGAVFFHLRPKKSFLADINLEVINVYRCIRDDVHNVIDLLREHHDRHCEDHYYHVRSQVMVNDEWFWTGNHLERAARILYLNKTCFNGLYRENSKGHFNVPMGKYKNPSIYDPDLLRACSASLKSTRIEPVGFEEVLKYAKSSKDFVYFDPPYHPISPTSKFTSYNRYSFLEAEQTQLRDVFAKLCDRGVKVMLSNSDCEFIRELYAGYNIHTIYASRHINSNGSKRGKITELLITSY